MSNNTSDNHIIELIENSPLSALSERELTSIADHTSHCEVCRKVYAAAEVCTALLKERADETFAPSPFFQTRVMATMRERQTTGDVWSLARLWRTAGALASSMVATVVLLGVLTFVLPANQSSSQNLSTAANRYSAEEEVILNQSTVAASPASDSQVLTTLYGNDEEATQ